MGHLVTAACVHYHVTRPEPTFLLSLAKPPIFFAIVSCSHSCVWLATPSVPLITWASSSFTKPPAIRVTSISRKSSSPCAISSAAGRMDNQDRIPFTQQTNAIGPCCSCNYLYAGGSRPLPRDRRLPLFWSLSNASGPMSSSRRCTSLAVAAHFTTAHRRMVQKIRRALPAFTRPTVGTINCRT